MISAPPPSPNCARGMNDSCAISPRPPTRRIGCVARSWSAASNPSPSCSAAPTRASPAELVFDQGFGDLFVIRVAGNIVAPSQVGSVEFAAARYGTRLVVVMGHSQCGAVAATLEELLGGTTAAVEEPALHRGPGSSVAWRLCWPAGKLDPEALMREAVRANVRASVDQLRHGSELLEELITKDGLMVVGAEYSLESGVVTFFDGS